MTDLTAQKTRGLGRRTLLRSGLLVGLGAAVVTVAAPNLAGVARAADSIPVEAPNGNIMEFTCQPGWSWCKYCQGLFYGTAPIPGCASNYDDFLHVPGSNWNYQVPFGAPPSGGSGYLQAGWQYCDNCNGLFDEPDNNTNSCCIGNGGGPHQNNFTGTYPYYLPYQAGWRGGPMQSEWAWCDNCNLLFFGPNWSSSVCPKGPYFNNGKHVRGARDYYAPSPSA
jgi:hypothetical protein